MAPEDGRTHASLIARLLREPQRFDLFQAVRLLERPVGGERPAPVGEDGPPDREGVRLRAVASLAFPTGDLAESRPARGDGRPRGAPELAVAAFGLTGPAGVLPHHYTALLLRRLRQRDESLRDFLDLFHHRLLGLFVRAWRKYRLPFSFERSRLDGHPDDPVSAAIRSLVGLGTPGLRDRLEVPDAALLYYAGHFAHRPRSASALGQVLADYLALPIEVLQAQGQWLHLEPEDRSRLPGAGRRRGQNHRLGIDLVLGARVFDVQGKFRLRVGPLSYAQFRTLMPDGHALRPLCQLARSYVGPGLDFDVQPVLRAAEIPPCRPGATGDDAPRLGWNTWLYARPTPTDVAGPTFAAGGPGAAIP